MKGEHLSCLARICMRNRRVIATKVSESTEHCAEEPLRVSEHGYAVRFSRRPARQDWVISSVTREDEEGREPMHAKAGDVCLEETDKQVRRDRNCPCETEVVV